MMASSKEFNLESSASGFGDDDIRGDNKKKKFKPLSAMKKFFTKKRDKKDTVVTVKAKSTTALHSGYRTDGEDEDDDDGGFKSHPTPLSLAVNRSLSEDSVFSPEPRGASIAASFPKTAVSEESLPKSSFQSELLSKLTKRQSQYSDDYHDDGLPRSPVPPITTADVIMGRQLKKQAEQTGKTSNNRDSDQSLISVDSSENEEDELFRSKWKSSVSAKKPSTSPSTSNNTMDNLDFNSIQKTDLLVSKAAKDRIMVKPPKRASKQTRHRGEPSTHPTSLPSLNEELTTKYRAEIIKENIVEESLTKHKADIAKEFSLRESPTKHKADIAKNISLRESPTKHKPDIAKEHSLRESPTKHKADITKEHRLSGSHIMVQEKVTSPDEKTSLSGMPVSYVVQHTAKIQEKTLSEEKLSMFSVHVSHTTAHTTDNKTTPVISAASKPTVSSIPIISKESHTESPITSPTAKSAPVVLPTTTASTPLIPSSKMTTLASPVVSIPHPKEDISPSSAGGILLHKAHIANSAVGSAPQHKADIACSTGVSTPQHKADIVSSTGVSIQHPTDIALSAADQSLSTSSPNATAAITVAENTVTLRKTDILSSSERGDKFKLSDLSVRQLSQSEQELYDNKTSVDFKSRRNQFQRPVSSTETRNIIINTPLKDLSVVDSDPLLHDPLLITSASDDYKTKHQIRSKTLPAVKDEQSATKVQRSRSHRTPNTGLPEPKEQLENTNLLQDSTFSATEASLDGKRPERSKLNTQSQSAFTSEPSWISIARKRNADNEVNAESDKIKSTETVAVKQSTPAPKSVFTSSSSSYLEKKRGSIETISFKNKQLDQANKNESSETKQLTDDTNSQNKQFTTDTTSVKKEIFETNVSLGSVKTSMNLFNVNSKSGSLKEGMHSVTPVSVTTSERVKLFSNSSSGISSSLKPASTIANDSSNVTPVDADNAKATSGAIYRRIGSVKSIPSNSMENKSRGGSIKQSSSVAATAETSLHIEQVTHLPSKPDQAAKSDNLGAPTTSALPSAPHASMHLAAQPISSSLPTQTPSVTPVSFFIKPFTAYFPKSASNIASALRPASNASIPQDTKHLNTSTTITNPIAANTNNMPSTLNTANDKGFIIPTAKASALPSVSANFTSSASTSSSPAIINITTTTSSELSSSVTSSNQNSVKPNLSVNTSTPSKPHKYHNAPPHATKPPIYHHHNTSSQPINTSSLIYESPSFKAVTVSSEKVAFIEKPTPVEKAASVGNAASTVKVTSEKATTDAKKPPTPAKVPAWRTHISKEVKIEVIENSPLTPSMSTSVGSEILRPKGRSYETPKKTEISAVSTPAVEAEKIRRSSKVLDMVKNFQNLQAPS